MKNEFIELIEQQIFVQGTLPPQENEIHFRACEFQQVEFTSGNDWIFEHCRFDACDFTDAQMLRASFLHCKFDGCEFNGTALDESQLLDCDLIATNYVNCDLYGVKFVNTDLVGVALLGCDARYATFENVFVKDATFDDTVFFDANLSGMLTLNDSQIASASGNSRTILPDGVERPAEWDDEQAYELGVDIEDGIPGQVAAPLKVIWRNDKLVPDPRGIEDDEWKNSSVTVIFTSLQAQVVEFLEGATTNHPIIRPIRSLNDALKRGLSALNPVAVGYNIEIIKAHLTSAEEELTGPTVGLIRAIVAGGEILASQFSEWREVASLREVTESDRAVLGQVASALQSLAVNARNNKDLFDRRISDTLDNYAEEVKDAAGNARVQIGVSRSSGNVLSALAGRCWLIITSGAKVASQEALKQLIMLFFRENSTAINALIAWAPSTLGWLRHFLSNLR